MYNFVLSVRDGKPVIAPLEIGVADAQAVIYGNRAVETGQRVYWPNAQPQKDIKKGSKTL
jgi:hypothetical protein